MRTRAYVKICGLTNVEDATFALEQGADLLGMVFHIHSRRICEIPVAQKISEMNLVKPKVLVFGHDDIDYIMNIYVSLRGLMTFLQIPGDHEFYDKIEEMVTANRIIPSIPVKGPMTDHDLERYQNNSLLILDNSSGNGPDGKPIAGGTGKTFNWDWVQDVGRPFLLAGGLNPENIENAIREVDPFGFDVAGGIESQPGIKDHLKLTRFMKAVIKSDERK